MDLTLENLHITNFKNITELDLSLNKKINCFVGLNGAGKTNILDAIFYLSFTKSYFATTDAQNTRHGQDFFMLKGIYQRLGSREEILISYQKDQKTVKRNNKRYQRLSQHIGLIPAIIITPDDIKLITGTGEERRRLMDMIISQADLKYITTLSAYRKILQQRNKLIKTFARERYVDEESLMLWDEQLSEAAEYIFQKRQEFISELVPIIQHYYNILSDNKEQINLRYKSHLAQGDFRLLLKQNLKRDIALEYTYAGIHRDDLDMLINGKPIRKFGSQGQQKSFLIALKFAQHDFIRDHLKVKPLLLLDDIFDKLDPVRVEKLVGMVSQDLFGQIFITHTNEQRLKQILHNLEVEYKIFHVHNGSIDQTLENTHA